MPQLHKHLTLAATETYISMNVKDKEIVEKAIGLQAAGRHKDALEILHELENKYSDLSSLYGLIASSYYQLCDYKSSTVYFHKTLTLNPNSELASLGLFHSLDKIGELKKAFLEMERFLAINKPKLYTTTLLEMKENIDYYTKSYQRTIIEKHSK
jgi:tetratricopeptide (TPR) repeat protein